MKNLKTPATSASNPSDSTLTPLMNQYQSIKSAHPDYIVFFRLGDFYEMFGEDAITAAPILGVVLTKRQNVPMCGVPHHSASNYIKSLLNAGKKVAVCEQTGNPAEGKKLITREIVRLITPGTVWEDNLLEVKRNNYIMAMIFSSIGEYENVPIGIAAADISSSDCYLSETLTSNITSEIARTDTKEIVVPESQRTFAEKLISTIKNSVGKDVTVSTLPDWHFDAGRAIAKISEISGIRNWESIDPDSTTERSKNSTTHNLARKAMGGLLSYLEHIKFEGVENIISRARFKKDEEYLYISPQAIRALEIISPMMASKPSSSDKENTLLGMMDRTTTPMGSRLLSSFITSPLTDTTQINQRLETVEYFVENPDIRRRLREILKNVGDIERILTRIIARAASPREIYHLGTSVKKILSIKDIFQQTDKNILTQSLPEIIKNSFATFSEKEPAATAISDIIEKSINPDAGNETGYIKPGYNRELDELRSFSDGARNKLLEIERRERERTGISSLKIGYTSVFGYYIEVRKTNLSSVPPDYIRKQTLANAERFVIQELIELENKILHAAENISTIEKSILSDIREKIRDAASGILEISRVTALIDVLSSFAEVATTGNWTKPSILPSSDGEDIVIDIEGLRHPVVEKNLMAGRFVPNDVHLSNIENQILLITGPNMGGKSTYLRQTALAVILAQSGSFVPAQRARLSIVDKIFTRVGSADNLAAGESTFMTEMTETAAIMRHMTNRSLIILDEVGRGTATFDGISIAWAIIEYLHNYGDRPPGGPRVLFATHYFELTELAENLPRLKNFHVSATEWKNEVVFLYKIEPGAADRSYGIHVAKLAGMPGEIIESSRRILKRLETNSRHLLKIRSRESTEEKHVAKRGENYLEQMDFEDFMIFDKLKNIDVNKITPLEALNILSELSSDVKKRKL